MGWFKKLSRPIKIMLIIMIVPVLFVGSAVVAGVYESITMSDEDRTELVAKQEANQEEKRLNKEKEKQAAEEQKEKEAAEKKLADEQKEKEAVEKQAADELAKVEKEKQTEKQKVENKPEPKKKPVKKEKPRGPNVELEIGNATINANEIIIKGTTNLPDGAVLIYSLDGKENRVTVEKEMWIIKEDLSKYDDGDISLWVSFNPNVTNGEQPAEIYEIYGDGGDKITSKQDIEEFADGEMKRVSVENIIKR